MPSVLVETGFLTNRKDEAFLQSEEGQALVAVAMLNAFNEYKAMLEGEVAENLVAPPVAQMAPPSMQTRAPEPAQATPEVVYHTPAPPPATSAPPAYFRAPVPNYQRPQVPSSSNNQVQAEPRIQPTPGQGTISTTTPAQERAWQPRAKGDTSWAENIGRETEENTVEGLTYCVQLAASPRPLNTRIAPWTDSNYLIEVLQESDLYKYQVRNFTKFDAATQVTQKRTVSCRNSSERERESASTE